MTISNKHLIDKINIEMVGSPTDISDVTALTKASIDVRQVFSVADLQSLPAALLNTGRLVWVQSIKDYRYSNGVDWVRDFNSTVHYENTVWAWGFAACGALGDNSVTNKSSPVSVVGGFTDWCQVSSGCASSAAVRTNGTIWSWGCAGSSQLGDNTVVSRSSPVSVVGGFTDWCQVNVGLCHTVALRTNGSIWTWGCNLNGQLGDNTTIAKSSPISVVGGFTDWCQVSAGGSHTSAVRTNGTIWAWGSNADGRLGDNTTIGKSSPVSVVGGFTDWCQVSAGSLHTVAIRTNGTIWSWGSNISGRLGDNTIVDKSSPVSVVGGFTDWCQVSTGGSHTAAVRTNGTIWTWGYNACGRLGDNTVVSRPSPVSVVGGFTDWCQVSASNGHTSAIRTNGTIWSWGCNASGQLGDNTIVAKSSPVSVASGFSDWCQVSAGSNATFAIKKRQIGF
jgi:alpha-tubulin suppressor-like RCC1 family protein